LACRASDGQRRGLQGLQPLRILKDSILEKQVVQRPLQALTNASIYADKPRKDLIKLKALWIICM